MRNLLPTAIVLLLAVAALAACGEKDEPDLADLPAPPEPVTTTDTTTPVEPKPPDDKPGDGQPGGGDSQQPTPQPGPTAERKATNAARAYFTWIDNRRGRELCTLIDETALARLKLPVNRGGCGPSLTASIGYRDPRGLPVFEGLEVREMRVRVNGRDARVTATVSTSFADRGQPSIEEDIVYLTLRGGQWIVAKPSSTLYRAIGVADIPASVLSPPR